MALFTGISNNGLFQLSIFFLAWRVTRQQSREGLPSQLLRRIPEDLSKSRIASGNPSLKIGREYCHLVRNICTRNLSRDRGPILGGYRLLPVSRQRRQTRISF